MIRIFLLNQGVIKFLTVTSFFIMLASVIWGIDKGFDISDEGYYLLGYQSKQDLGFSTTGFHQLIKGLFSFMSLNVINVRILRLLFCLVSTLFLGLGVRYYLDKKYDLLNIFCFLGIGTLFSYCFGPQSLSYNSLVGFFSVMIFSFFLIGLNSKNYVRKFSFVLVGVFLTFTLIVKFPPFIIYILILTSLLIFCNSYAIKTKLNIGLFIFIGLTLGLSIFSFFCMSIYDFTSKFFLGISYLKSISSGHNIQDTFTRINEILKLFIAFSIASALIYFICKFIKRLIPKPTEDYIQLILFSLVVVLLQYFHFIDLNYNGISIIIFMTVFFLITFSNKLFVERKKHSDLTVILIICFILPFIGSLGTNNSFLFNSGFMISLWFSAVTIIIDKADQGNVTFNFVYILLIFACSFLFVQNYFQNPYRITKLHTQTEKIKGEIVKLDKDSKLFVTEIDSILVSNGFKKGDPIIGLYKIPGLVYLLNGISPGGISSLWDNRRNKLFLNELEISTMDYSKSYFIIGDKLNDSLIIGLNELNLKFPEEFINIGSVKSKNIYHSKYNYNIYAHISKANNSNDILYKLHKAYDLLKKREFEESIILYENIILLDSNNTTALNNIGYAFMQLKKYNKAIKFFENSIKIKSDYQLAINNLKWAKSMLREE